MTKINEDNIKIPRHMNIPVWMIMSAEGRIVVPFVVVATRYEREIRNKIQAITKDKTKTAT